MRDLILFCLWALVITSCSDKQMKPKSMNGVALEVGNPDSNETNNSIERSKSGSIAVKIYNGVSYSIDLINAVDFVTRKGEKLDLSERLELSKESVAILKIDLNNIKETSVFESSKMTMNKEDALQYLVGQILDDLTVEQNGQSISPVGVEYDAGVSGSQTIKVFLFFNNINLNKPSNAVYYDRLFGAGLMRFKINN
jgi:hypothetical protein